MPIIINDCKCGGEPVVEISGSLVIWCPKCFSNYGAKYLDRGEHSSDPDAEVAIADWNEKHGTDNVWKEILLDEATWN